MMLPFCGILPNNRHQRATCSSFTRNAQSLHRFRISLINVFGIWFAFFLVCSASHKTSPPPKKKKTPQGNMPECMATAQHTHSGGKLAPTTRKIQRKEENRRHRRKELRQAWMATPTTTRTTQRKKAAEEP